MRNSDLLSLIVVKLPQDYEPWGTLVRWEHDDHDYCDCSSGCRHYFKLADSDGERVGSDLGVCGNPASHRVGLLTFEHQGCQQFEE